MTADESRQEKICENCRYAEPTDQANGMFRCRRYAPRALVADIDNKRPISWWPRVDGADWCGEFKPHSPMITVPSIEDFGFRYRTQQLLHKMGVSTTEGLLDRSEADLMGTWGFGHICLQEVKSKLKLVGLSLRSEA